MRFCELFFAGPSRGEGVKNETIRFVKGVNATGRSQELRRLVAKKEGARDHERERS